MSLSGSKKKNIAGPFSIWGDFPGSAAARCATWCDWLQRWKAAARTVASTRERIRPCHRGLGVPGGRWKWQPAAAARPVCKQLSHKQGRPGSARMSAPLSTSRHINERRLIHNEGTEKVIKIDGGTCQGKNDDAKLSLRFVCGRAGKMFITHNPHVMLLKSLKGNNVNSCELKCLFR